MNELLGNCVNVVLVLEIGEGFNFLQKPVKIVATFNGKPLESNFVEPCENPEFNIELVWETDKKELRKLRTANSPIRVEVETTDDKNRKQRIGFALLSPRCASVISGKTSLHPLQYKWQRLLGVNPSNKIYNPSLSISLTIRDSIVPNLSQEVAVSVSGSKLVEEDVLENVVEMEDETFPIQYIQDGFVQIGSENCSETFVLTFTVQVAYHLDLLLPEVLVFNKNPEKYFMSFKVFGVIVKSKPFFRDVHANIPMNEKIVVRMRSDFDTLKTYFVEYCKIMISFYCGRDKLGTTQLSTQQILEDLSEEEFLARDGSITCEQKCMFRFPSQHGIVPTGPNGRQPFIEVAVCLSRTDAKPQSVPTMSLPSTESLDSVAEVCEECEEEEDEELTPKASDQKHDEVKQYIDDGDDESSDEDLVTSRAIGSGDCDKKLITSRAMGSGDEEQVQEVENNRQVCSELNLTEKVEEGSQTSRSADAKLKVPALTIPRIIFEPTKVMIYQQYCLDIVVETITLKKHIKDRKLWLKFKHPKASTYVLLPAELETRVGDESLLDNVRCKMFFISSTEQIRKMVYAWHAKLVLLDESKSALTEDLDIYTAMFLGKDRNECSYVTECKAVRTYEPLAKLSIIMYLQEYGLTALPQPTESDLLPPVLDEDIAVKELRELQAWKEMQKAHFSADLKITEKERLLKLQMSWSAKKKELETKLSKSVTRCQNLSQELQTAVNHVRTKNALQQKESEMSSKLTLEDSVQENCQKYCDFKNKELIKTISKLERENLHLNGIIGDLRQEMQQIKKTALTKEQTASLLQQLKGLEEKFEGAQKTKLYFKEQWQKAVKEIHVLRSEDQKQMQDDIQNNKIELSELNLDNFAEVPEIGMQLNFDQRAYGMHSATVFNDYDLDLIPKTSPTSLFGHKNL